MRILWRLNFPPVAGTPGSRLPNPLMNDEQVKALIRSYSDDDLAFFYRTSGPAASDWRRWLSEEIGRRDVLGLGDKS